MIKAIIFDFDGTLVDSERVKIEAAIKTFKELGMPLNDLEIQSIAGKSSKDFVPNFLLDRGIVDDNISRETLNKHKSNYDVLWEEIVTLTPGVDRVIPALVKQGKKLAIVTMNRISTVDKFFTKFGFRDYFAIVITIENVNHRKPDPEVYNIAMEKLGISSQEGLAVEDNASGVLSAKAAGLQCIAIPNKYSRNEDFSSADQVIDSVEGILYLL